MVKSDTRTLRFWIGTVLVTLFAVLCVAPLIYMVLVSFTDSPTLYISWSDIDFTDFSNYVYLFVSRDFARPLLNSVIVVVLGCILVNLVSCTAGPEEEGLRKDHIFHG